MTTLIYHIGESNQWFNLCCCGLGHKSHNLLIGLIHQHVDMFIWCRVSMNRRLDIAWDVVILTWILVTHLSLDIFFFIFSYPHLSYHIFSTVFFSFTLSLFWKFIHWVLRLLPHGFCAFTIGYHDFISWIILFSWYRMMHDPHNACKYHKLYNMLSLYDYKVDKSPILNFYCFHVIEQF